MLTAQIDFEILGETDIDERDDRVYTFVSNLLKDGRTNDDYQVFKTDKTISIILTIPANDAFENFKGNKYIAQSLSKLSEVNLGQPTFKILGETIYLVPNCECKSPSSYILFTSLFSSSVSPLHCFDCFKACPLYRLPRKNDEGYERFYWWESDYIACDKLQMKCETGEKFGLREMFEVESSLSKRGLELCDKIKEITGKNCYYFLYKYRGKSLKKERERKCPKCNNEWLLEEKLHKSFDFKCDKCNLLANIADSLG
jgi:predicted  nucleic acid-binding Zn ribbon protein